MQLIYEGTDITQDVRITACVHRDACQGRSDGLNIELHDARDWYRWGPRMDDTIEVRRDGYTTGTMYLSAVCPTEGKYRLLASSMPSAARRSACASYENRSLSSILAACAAECGMDSAIYGDGGSITYPYAVRSNETAPAFLERLMRLEGMVLKTVNGRMNGISVAYAQAQRAVQTIHIGINREGIEHIVRPFRRLGGLQVKGAAASGAAKDNDAPRGTHEVISHLPVTDYGQAARWARGLLTMHNRESEEIMLRIKFNPFLTAMARIDVKSDTDMDGDWLVEEAEHDFKNGQTRVRLLRCITGIR